MENALFSQLVGQLVTLYVANDEYDDDDDEGENGVLRVVAQILGEVEREREERIK